MPAMAGTSKLSLLKTQLRAFAPLFSRRRINGWLPFRARRGVRVMLETFNETTRHERYALSPVVG
jgi:hypothetical protein